MSDTTELVDLAVIFPDLEIELKYACADNITGKAIYQQARCLLHKDAITALAKSISIAQLSGLQLVIYDAYRPQQAQAMLEQLSEDYIRTARASGLPGWYIVLCYALPNALIPSITVLGLALGDLLYGAVLTETVFAWPGMGAWVVTSIQALDFPAVMGFAVVVSFAYVLVNLVVDLLYLWIDPRIGRGGGE